MRALVITEQWTPASFQFMAPSKPTLLICCRSSYLIKRLQRCILLFFGLFVCCTFVFAIFSVEESMKLAGKRSPQQRRLMGFNGNTHRLKEWQETEPRISTTPSHALVKEGSASMVAPHLCAESALHGLGHVYMKGTKSMQNLIVANLEETCDMLDFRIFLRTLYRSGTMSRADLVFLFPWPSLPKAFSDIVKEEGDSVNKLLGWNIDRPTPSSHRGSNHGASAEFSQRKIGDFRSLDRGDGHIIWGVNPTSSEFPEQNSSDFGSVVGFNMNDLDSTDAYADFLNNPSSELRRWVCYQMLLGLLRFKFKLVMLVELGGVAILGDVFANGKRKDFLHLTLEDFTWADKITEFDHESDRESSILGGFQGTEKSTMGSHNMLDDTGFSPTTKQRKTHKPKGGSIVRGQFDDLFGGGSASEQHKHGKAEDSGSPDEEKRVESMHDATKYARGKEGLIETVYGKEVWDSLEQMEKQRRVVSSRVILGSMRCVRRLTSSMVIEIVRVALQRKSKLSFPDCALLSYLVQKSSHLLGKKVTENLEVMGGSESLIHSVERSRLEDMFVRTQDGQKYTVLQASSLNARLISAPFPYPQNFTIQSNTTLGALILSKLCVPTSSSAFYRDCHQQQFNTA